MINADQPWAQAWRARATAATVLDFGLVTPAAITARDVRPDGARVSGSPRSRRAESWQSKLSLPGVHNVATRWQPSQWGSPAAWNWWRSARGLNRSRPPPAGFATAVAPRGATVIDDCYNANPGSVRAAIDMLAGCAGRRTLVLGAMRELGPTSEVLHRKSVNTRGPRAWSSSGVGSGLREAVAALAPRALVR